MIRFAMLTFVCDIARKSGDGHCMSRWKCDCGAVTETQTRYVRKGTTKSCGCLQHTRKPNLRHGMRGTRTYVSWTAMKRRCLDPNNKDYPRWGGKGVKICQRWLAFENFLADMGVRPGATTIDRYPNRHGDYGPGNCRWASAVEQQENKDNFAWVETPVGTIPLRDYALHIGISLGAAHLRLKRGKLEGCRKCV